MLQLYDVRLLDEKLLILHNEQGPAAPAIICIQPKLLSQATFHSGSVPTKPETELKVEVFIIFIQLVLSIFTLDDGERSEKFNYQANISTLLEDKARLPSQCTCWLYANHEETSSKRAATIEPQFDKSRRKRPNHLYECANKLPTEKQSTKERPQ